MKERHWKELGWGAIVSVALHAAFVIALFVYLPAAEIPPPEEEESVSVELVAPPEEEPPPEPAPEEPAPEEPAAEEQAQEPTPPEPPPPPPPEQQAPEQAQQQAPVDLPDQGPLPILRPVLEFGDENTGARTDTSDLSRGGAKPEQQAGEETAEPPKPEEPVEPPTPEEPAEAVESAATPMPQELQPPETDTEAGLPTALADGEPADSEEAAKPEEAAKADAETAAEPSEAPEDPMDEAEKLYSQDDTGDTVARTAMGNLPRGVRIEQLCSTELLAQLRHGSPSYNPELLPSYRPTGGTVLDIRRAAFRANTRWYDLSFRCEVDPDATRVISFAFDVGAEVPRSEWSNRGFPSL